MSEMTATRMGRVGRAATLAVAIALWLVAAALLWRTRVPGDLVVPRLEERAIFTAAELRRADQHVRFLRADLLLSALAQLAVLAFLVRRPPRLRPLPLAALALAAAWLAALPFAVAAHWWERRYGIELAGYGDWFAGRLPGLALAVGGGTVAVGALLVAGARWRLAAWPLLCALALAYVLLSPLGSGGRPRGRIDGVRVIVQDVHRDTRLANAEAVGVGFTERIVLWDTLLRFPRPDVRVVEQHELAHFRRHHLWKGLAWFVLLSLPATIVLVRVATPSDPPRLLLAAAVLGLAALPLANTISRRYEREADWLALERTRDPAAARDLFVRFAQLGDQQPSPPRLLHVVLGDHPTPLERIELAEAWRARRR